MKFNLKLFVITFVLSSGFAYAAEQKEDFDNEDFKIFFDKKLRAFMEHFPGQNRAIEDFLSQKPISYIEWKMQIATNPEESLFYLLDHPDYINDVFKPEFDQKIEELIKNKTDINNNKYTNGQTLMMKILGTISKTIEHEINALRLSERLAEHNLGLKNTFIAQAAQYQKSLSKLNDVFKKVLPNVNDFYVKDGSGKTVFDYAKGNEEITKLLKLALEERKQEIRRSLQHHIIPELQSIVCDY